VLIEIPCPPSVNTLFRNVQGKGRVRTKKYTDWQKRAEAAIAAHPPFKAIKGGAYRVSVRVGKFDNRRRDLDNLLKAPLDLLNYLQLTPDDSLCMDVRIQWSLDVAPRMMEITVKECDLVKFEK
jgi:crossover junction endodeoxyribonuclease RusA